jgi:hypothetical protein
MSMGWLAVLSVVLFSIGYWMGRRPNARRWLPPAIGLAAALLPVAATRAQSGGLLPFTFTNGTIADANQVNQNFTSVATKNNSLAAEIASLRTQQAILASCDFRARDESAAMVECAAFGGGAFIVSGPSPFGLVAPLHIPAGATTTSVHVGVTDKSSVANLQVCLVGEDEAGNQGIAQCASTSGAPDIVTLDFNAQAFQGSGQALSLFVFSENNSGGQIAWPGSDLVVHTAYVSYQLP